MKLNPGKRLTIAFLLLLVVIFLLVWRTQRNNEAYLSTFFWIEHTQQVLLRAEQISSYAKDLERGSRGYVITGDTDFLKPFYESKENILRGLQSLKELTSDNPTQQIRIDSLNKLLITEINVMQACLTLRMTVGFEAAKGLVATRKGFNNMNNIQNTVSKIKEEEVRLLNIRQHANEKSRTALNRFSIILASFLFLILTVFFVILYSSFKKRDSAENLLRQNKELLQSIIDNTSSVIYIKDTSGRFTLVNKELERSHNLTREYLIGKTVFDFCQKEYALKYTEIDQQVLREGKLLEVREDALILGKLHHFYSIKFPLLDQDSKPYAICGISTNITALISRQELERQKEIAATAIQSQEKERTEIGKELHDNINQLLASAKMMIDIAQCQPEIQDECLKRSKEIMTTAIDEIRAISHAMMPPSFEETGFTNAIYEIGKMINMEGNISLKIELPSADQLSALDNSLKLAIYRIIQEQVTNMLKYSKARNAAIVLELHSSYVLLKIEDDGIGADLKKQESGIGLRNIASRVNLYNGELKINTAPDQGFQIATKFFLDQSMAPAI